MKKLIATLFVSALAAGAEAQVFTLYGAESEFNGHFSAVDVASGKPRTITPNSGGFYAGMDSLYRIDLQTVSASLIGITGGNLISIASVPEPHPFALLALGCLGFLCRTRPATLRK